MSIKPPDQEIVAALAKNIGAIPTTVAYDEVDKICKLDLSGINLSQLPLPPEIGWLTNLQVFSLDDTELSELPPEIWQLTNLQELSLRNTRLSELPPEIGRLTNLQRLSLGGTHLARLPREIGRLSNLQRLSIRNTLLSELPAEIGLLTSLKELYLYDTQLSLLPPEIWQLNNLQVFDLSGTQLSQLPAEIGQLTHLQELNLRSLQLSELPAEIGRLTSVQRLSLSGTQLKQLPPEIGRLASLRRLSLRNTRLSELLPEIGRLTNLQVLYLYDTQLSHLPPEIWQLTNLQELSLRNTRLSELPPEIGRLTNLQRLSLSGTQLSELPAEIGQLSNLQVLSLDDTELSQLPAEIGQLSNLQVLSLDDTELSQLPAEIGQLTHLQELSLRNTLLSELPAEIGRLTSVQRLSLSGTQLKQLPPEIGRLASLRRLSLRNTRLSELLPEIGRLANLQVLYLYDTQLSHLPPEIWQLTNLQELSLRNTRLSELPPEIGRLTNLQRLSLENTHLNKLPVEIEYLTNLQELSLGGTQLRQLPPEIGRLSSLQELDLRRLHLDELPSEIGQLSNLQRLSLGDTELSQLPAEIGRLSNLQRLSLRNTGLSQLPAEIGQLSNLKELYLSDTRLSHLPLEIGQLANLQVLNVANIPSLLTPPPEIIARGTADMLNFLRELKEKGIARHESKLLIVGEGGTGKSSLVRALRNDVFDRNLPMTHGIEIDRLELAQPHYTIILNAWDFGGQQIYHTTHQFFLTKRSLYISTWNARLGVEQGRLNYWLDTIKALAPDAPILLVATFIDEHPPDLNYQLYKHDYPQLVGSLGVSNRTGEGHAQFKMELVEQAIRLPLMGQAWPSSWQEAEQILLARPEHHIDANEYVHYCSLAGVEADIAKGTLGNYLHDLGKILYFRDDFVLSDLVVLKPNWVAKAISRVLDDEATRKAKGILLHSDLPRIWSVDEEGQPYEPHLYPVLLRLMERFELSYQIETETPNDSSTRSLIPQLLPHEPPVDLPPWPKAPTEGQAQVEMLYRLDSVPAGIMSRFIVRTQRYTQNLHWREGVLLSYQGHQARVELNPRRSELHLLVQGPLPQNFFTILMNTIDVILARFEGLDVKREVPCICHWTRAVAEPCPAFYHYEYLVRRMEAARYEVECPESFIEVSVPMLLYGIHSSTNQQVIADIQRGQQQIQQGQQEMQQSLKELQKLDVITKQLSQQSELIARNFTRQWNLEMQKMKTECPNTFVLMPGSDSMFNPKNWVSQEYWLYLVCQHPLGPHRVGKGYSLRKAEEWWISIRPWLDHLITFLKFAVPMSKAILGVYEADAKDAKQLQATLDLMEQITNSLPEPADLESRNSGALQPRLEEEPQSVGPALRALQSFLMEADPIHAWGDLYKTPTPDGSILWLCDVHREKYEAKLLKLDT